MTAAVPPTADTLIAARWIIPVEPRGEILENRVLALQGGRILGIFSTEEAGSIQAERRFSLPNHALLPGLINAHGHAAMSLFRGMADDLPLDTWLNDHIWPAEAAVVNADFVADGAKLAIAEMLRCGTTCFSDMYFFPEVTAKAAAQAGMRAQLAFPIFEFPSAWGQGPDEYIRKGLQLRDDFKNSPLIQIAFGPHAPYTVGDSTLERVATLAAELDSAIQIHVHETSGEVERAVAEAGERPLNRLARFGLLGPRTQCVHLASVNDDDIRLLADNNCHAVHCPESNLKLASGFSPVQAFIKAGINVALGTDGAASNNDLDLPAEMRLAALLAKAVAGDAAALPDQDALAMATINGARAMGLEQQLGSLEAGKLADVIAVDLSALEQQPMFNPLSALVYTNISQRVSHSWINGRLMLDNRELTTLNTEELIQRADFWRNTISKR